MEALLRQIIQLSSSIIEQVDKIDLESLEAYMQQRDQLFGELQKLAPTSEQVLLLRPLAAQIQEQDHSIVNQMVELRSKANNEMDKLNRGKLSKSAYDSSPYGEDSLFFDAKR